MKKIVFIILTLSILLFGSNVKAASIATSISGPTKIDPNSEFTIQIAVSSKTGVEALQGALNYDKTKVKYISSNGLNGYTLTYGSRFALDTIAPLKSGKVMYFKFKALNGFLPGQTTMISLSNVSGVIVGTDGDVSASNSSIRISVNTPKSSENHLSKLTVDGKVVPNFNTNTLSYNLGTVTSNTIKIGATPADSKAKITGTGTKTLSFGNNTFSIKVTAENGSTRTYKITVKKKDTRDSNNTLQSITVKGQPLAFRADTLNYTLNVDKDVESITISAETASKKASVSGTGTKDLKVGANNFKIVVTAENKSTKTYQITVVRKSDGTLSNDTRIKSVIINDQKVSLQKDKAYLMTVSNNTTKLEIDVVPNDANATVTMEGNDLIVGSNTVKIIVQAQDGSKEVYTLHVVRKDATKYYQITDQIGSAPFHLLIKDQEPSSLTLSAIRKINEDIYIDYLDAYGNSIQTVQIVGNKLPYAIDDLFKIVTNSGLNDIFQNTYRAFELQHDEKAQYTVYVGDIAKDGIIYLYTYDKDNIQLLKQEELKAENGFVHFEHQGKGSYVFSVENIKIASSFHLDIKDIIMIVETIMIVAFGILYIRSLKQIKQLKKPSRKKRTK